MSKRPQLKSSIPVVLGKKEVFSTPWVRLMEKKVDLADGGPPQAFYALEQCDYVAMVAVTPSGKVLTVRQYRPAVEQFTLELPAGTIEQGEDPQIACLRELEEETGHTPIKVQPLGTYFPDTGRMLNIQYAYFIEVSETPAKPATEAGVELEYYTFAELQEMIRSGEFRHQLHISVLLLAALLVSEPKWK